ncbi:YfhL family 4Fe-4S dicluster ferredoxin [Candidatus Providencia siddallii]|uniref:Ferredoxin YfhL, partial n=1 Tax=Candidatus Providencia siddallii TaxID=1715285 RepID=A0ABM9NPN1_9GAMM
MSLIITKRCVNCGVCELECPNNAIYFGKKFYEIDQKLCTECINYYNEPNCQLVCPITNVIIKKIK